MHRATVSGFNRVLLQHDDGSCAAKLDSAAALTRNVPGMSTRGGCPGWWTISGSPCGGDMIGACCWNTTVGGSRCGVDGALLPNMPSARPSMLVGVCALLGGDEPAASHTAMRFSNFMTWTCRESRDTLRQNHQCCCCVRCWSTTWKTGAGRRKDDRGVCRDRWSCIITPALASILETPDRSKVAADRCHILFPRYHPAGQHCSIETIGTLVDRRGDAHHHVLRRGFTS